MDRRAVVKTMNRVLEGMFDAPGYSRGAIQGISTGRRYYADDLKMLKEAGITEDQLARLFGFAQVSPTSQKMIRVLDEAQQVGQQPFIRNQKDLQQIRQLALTQHTKEFSTAFGNKYNPRDVKAAGYFSRLKQIMSNPAKLRSALQSSFVQGQPFRGVPPSDPRIRGLAKQIGVIETGVGHNLKFIEELNKIGKIFDTHRAQTQASRTRGSASWGNVSGMLNMMGSRSSSPYVSSTSNIKVLPQGLGPLPTNTSMMSAANEVVMDIYRRQALSKFQAPPTGFLDMTRSIAGANWPKVSGTPSVSVNRPKQSWFGRNKERILDVLMAVGGTGGLLGVTQSVFGGMPFPLPFASGGNVPKIMGSSLSMDSLPNISDTSNKSLLADFLNGVPDSRTTKPRSRIKIYPNDTKSSIDILPNLTDILQYLPGMQRKSFRGKFAKGGIPRNPIKVSDGELAISKGLTDKIGLDTLRKINAGDMSALSPNFSSGGMFEYNGPGTGTSDSILEDADKGPRGPDDSDVGFIIKRSSSDKLKGLLSGGINKARGFWGGGNPFAGNTASFSAALDAATRNPQFGNINTKTGRVAGFQTGIVKAIEDAFAASQATADIQDVLQTLLSNRNKTGFMRTAGKTKGFPNTAAFVNPTVAVLSQLFGQPLSNMGTPPLQGVKNVDQAIQLWIDSLNKSTIANNQNTQSTNQNTKSQNQQQQQQQQMGEYRGQLIHYPMRGTRFGETNVMGVVEGGGPGTGPLAANVLGSQGMAPRDTGGLRGFYNKNFAGFWNQVNKELFNPTEMSRRVSGSHEFVIGGQFTTEEEQTKMEANRREFDTYTQDVMQRFRDEFGDVLGNLNLEDLVKVTMETKKEQQSFISGYKEISNIDKSGKEFVTLEPEVSTLTREMGILNTNISALEGALKGRMRPEEFTLRSERAMQLSPQAREGMTKIVPKGLEEEEIIVIDEARTKMASFREEVKKTGMTGTLMYKFGDVMRGLSWRFASLSMSAMGVYFSIQGLMMTFQQGLGAIVTPLTDVEGLMKNIGMSTAFGDGIMNASKAMKDLGVDTDDFIQSWKNITNIQGTIQTLFASIGSKVFGDKKFTDQLLKGITDAFKTLDKGGIGETVKDLVSSIVKAIPAILPAIQSITKMLDVIANNPALVAMGAQLMVISLVLQPITSGIAAVITTLGGLGTGINLLYSTSKALMAVSVGANAASLGFTRMAAGVLAMSVVLIPLYEILANVINYMGLLGNFKLPTITGAVMGAVYPQGFASGGVVQSEGRDMVPGSADDTIITAKSGEMVLTKDQQKALGIKQSFAAGSPLLPSMMYSQPAANDTYQFSKSIDLVTSGNRNTQQTARVLSDVQNGDALNVNIVNWADFGGMGGGFTSPNISSVIGAPYHLNPNMAFAPGNFNPQIPLPTTTQITPTPTPPGTPTPQGQIPTNTGPTGTFTPTSIISDTVIGYVTEAFKRAGETIIASVQDAVGRIHDGLISSFDSIYSGLQNAGQAIQNIVGGILTINYEDVKKGAQTLAQSASNFLYGSGQPTGVSISPNAIPTGAGAGYENIFYSHAGYNPIGTTGDYIRQRTPRQGYMNRWRRGRYELPQMPPPPGRGTTIAGGRTPGAGQVTSGLTYPRATDFWSNKELFTAQWQDMGEVARALTTGDPLAVAKAYGSVLASNALVGGAGRLLQYGALRATSSAAYPVMGSIAGRGLAHAGSLFTGANVLAGSPYAIAGAGTIEAGQAFDEWAGGRTIANLQTGGFNAATGLLTGGAGTAGFGRGMEVWQAMSGLNEEEMRQRVKDNAWLFEAGIGPGKIVGGVAGALGFGNEYTDFFNKMKGGNVGVSNMLNQVPVIGEGLGALNEGIYDAVAQLANLDIGSLFAGGTSIVGIGAGTMETAGNAVNMAMQNPYTLGYGALQAGLFGAVPIPGLSIATNLLSDMLMPQTAKWAQEQGYGVIDATKMGWRSQTTAEAGSAFEQINMLTEAIRNYTNVMEANQTAQQPVEVTVKLQIDGNQIINATELTEFITNVQKRNQPNATR